MDLVLQRLNLVIFATCAAAIVEPTLMFGKIDAASYTGIDDARDNRGRKLQACSARYKIYIIDEVHMMSKVRSTL